MAKKKVIVKDKKESKKEVKIDSIIIPNTFGIKKYLDEEAYKQIDKVAKEKANEVGWKKFKTDIHSAEIIITKGDE